MSFPPGTRLGPYEVGDAIGAGGMGEVYRARDTRLNRIVALKVLPESFAKDAERLARFRREAQTLASLNHPHIAQIHGLEESRDTSALVMEFVDGEDLAMRLKRGPIPIDEALPIAKQIAEALAAAHDHGIVHRDLKPANIKVRNDGTVKVLDFGLAKACGPGAAGGTGAEALANSPTITSPAMTMQGVIMGTAAYMSPEQAKGRPVDQRTDVWAFGCVLFEMLTAARAFDGDNTTDILGAIVKTEPDWKRLPERTPDSIDRLIRRCLRKDRAERLQHIGDARLEIADALAGDAPAALHAPAKSRTRIFPLTAATLVIGVLIGAASYRAVSQPAPGEERPPTRFLLYPGPGERISTTGAADLAISRDGRRVATLVEPRRNIRVWSLDRIEGQTLTDTEAAETPSFSPDGQWLVYRRGGSVWKAGVDGSAPRALGVVTGATGPMNWTDRGEILIGSLGGGLFVLSADGGVVKPFLTLEGGEIYHRNPYAIAGTDIVLYTSGFAADTYRIMAFNVRSGERRSITSGRIEHYLRDGYLTFMNGNRAMIAAFDVKDLKLHSDPALLVDGVAAWGLGFGFTVSENGVIAHLPEVASASRTLSWIDRAGHEVGTIPVTSRQFEQPRLSPDGSRLAVATRDAPNPDVWTIDLRRAVMNRFSFAEVEDETPLWVHDGARIYYRSAGDLRVKAADNSGADQEVRINLTGYANPHFSSISPDGKLLAINAVTSANGEDIIITPLDGSPSKPFVSSRAAELSPAFSPDGRWLAYVSDESGQSEVYVATFPGPGAKWQISTDGGTEPTWSANGKEVFYRHGREMMAVSISVEPVFSPAKPVKLFEGDFLEGHRGYTNYDVSRDGRFLMIKGSADLAAVPIQIQMDMPGEFRRLAPVKK